MNIYTSYFGNYKALRNANILIVNVARWAPRFVTPAFSLLEVAPTPWMIKQATMEQYLSSYRSILARTNAHQLIEKIAQLSGGQDVALCCYEKSGEFCHRHMLAEHLTQQTGVEIKEFELPTPPPTPPTPSLFDPALFEDKQ